MNELKIHISARMTAARTSLRTAVAAGDDFLVSVREGELDSLTRLAEAHGIDVAELEAAELAATGLPVSGTLDLRSDLAEREPA